MKKIMLVAAALSLAAPLLLAPGQGAHGAETAGCSPRGQFACQIVRKWEPHVQEAYRTDLCSPTKPRPSCRWPSTRSAAAARALTGRGAVSRAGEGPVWCGPFAFWRGTRVV